LIPETERRVVDKQRENGADKNQPKEQPIFFGLYHFMITLISSA
jgi:translation elongation factor EF-1beta